MRKCASFFISTEQGKTAFSPITELDPTEGLFVLGRREPFISELCEIKQAYVVSNSVRQTPWQAPRLHQPMLKSIRNKEGGENGGDGGDKVAFFLHSVQHFNYLQLQKHSNNPETPSLPMYIRRGHRLCSQGDLDSSHFLKT